MLRVTRRDFLQTASLAAGAALGSGPIALASPFGLPIGLQLYSVREQLAKDYAGTLKQVAQAGYREVEAAGYFDQGADQVKQAMQAAGLRLVSAHYPYVGLTQDLEKTIAFNHDIGVNYIICASPGFKDPERAKASSAGHAQPFTIDDFRWNAEEFNRIGAKVKAAGLHFGYHNHTVEFHAQDGVIPMDELIRLTDPALVTFEMDCGWVVVGGGDPVDYLHRYPTRISMLHVKDFKLGKVPMSNTAPPPAAELGQGGVNIHAIFETAKKANIKHYFVEQEGYDMPVFEALKLDADYIKNLRS